MPTSMLAVKYRPTKFSEVHGQQHVVVPIQNAIKNNNLSQTLLLHGPSGTGKTTLARIIAKSVNCKNQKDGEPCCVCPNCRRIDSETSPDVIEFDAATNGGVNEIREIQTLVNSASLANHCRVFIIDEAHMLTNQASNALLKTLEEPPRNVRFILATTEPNKILTTIKTRCQKYALSPLKIDEVKACLNRITKDLNIEIEPQAANMMCRGSRGGMREAIQFLEKIVSVDKKTKIVTQDVIDTFGAITFNLLFSFLENVLVGSAAQAIVYIDNLIQDGLSVTNFWIEFQQFLRAMNICKQIQKIDDLQKLIHYDDASIKKLSNMVAALDNKTLLDAWKQAIETQNSIELPSTAGRVREIVEESSVRLCFYPWGSRSEQTLVLPKKIEESFTNGIPIFGNKFSML